MKCIRKTLRKKRNWSNGLGILSTNKNNRWQVKLLNIHKTFPACKFSASSWKTCTVKNMWGGPFIFKTQNIFHSYERQSVIFHLLVKSPNVRSSWSRPHPGARDSIQVLHITAPPSAAAQVCTGRKLGLRPDTQNTGPSSGNELVCHMPISKVIF